LNHSGRSNLDHWGGAVHPGYFNLQDAVIDDHTFHFAAVTDLDKLSVVTDSKKPLFRSTLLPGTLIRDDVTGRYSINFEKYRTLVSQHNEAGRGMELSELTVYKNRLLSFDDRTGTVFEILSTPDGQGSYVVPRFVITEGDGDTDKGMKWEWATIKNNELVLGSMGKEFTNPDGSIDNTNNMWVDMLNDRGELRRENWEDKFNFVRSLVGASPPGYIIMEAILWSDYLKKWVSCVFEHVVW
jgi:soluble calcium-activated nucleotidase 1